MKIISIKSIQRMDETEVILQTPGGKEKYTIQTDENLTQSIFSYKNDMNIYNTMDDINTDRRELLVKTAGEIQKKLATQWAMH